MNFHNQQQELAMLETMTKPEMTTSSMWITPQIATELLGGNINNRRLRLRYVRDLAAMMRRGLNHQCWYDCFQTTPLIFLKICLSDP